MVRKMSWMVWLCEFQDDINCWDLKILYRDLKSWKKNEMVCRIRKLNDLEYNWMEWDGLGRVSKLAKL